MHRDLDLMRKTLLLLEDVGPAGRALLNAEDQWAHVQLLADDGLVAIDGGSICRLTMDGHDVCELVRSERRWANVMDATFCAGGAPWSVIVEILMGAIAAELQTSMQQLSPDEA